MKAEQKLDREDFIYMITIAKGIAITLDYLVREGKLILHGTDEQKKALADAIFREALPLQKFVIIARKKGGD